MFIVPTNDMTRTLDYGMRFMLSDNPIHPTTYEITKMTTLFPIGISKIVLKQDHYNKEEDNTDLKICNYYTPTTPIEEENIRNDMRLRIVGANPTINLGKKRKLEILDSNGDVITDEIIWSYSLNGETPEENQFTYETKDNYVILAANVDYSMIGKILKVEARNTKTKVTVSTELEVLK